MAQPAFLLANHLVSLVGIKDGVVELEVKALSDGFITPIWLKKED